MISSKITQQQDNQKLALMLENMRLREQLSRYKQKYQQLKIMYQVLAKKYSERVKQQEPINLLTVNQPNKDSVNYQKQEVQKKQQIEENQNIKQQESGKDRMSRQITQGDQQSYNLLELDQSISNSRLTNLSIDNIDIPMKLVEGCFIIQKVENLKLDNCLKFYYPENIMPKYKQLLDLIIKYSFTNPNIYQIIDDDFDSRKNQIHFGGLFQDIFYAFQNNQQHGQLSKILKKIHGLPKRYIHAIMKPQVQVRGQKSYQTEVIYGFISSLPLRPIFFDLNRVMLQQIKYYQLLKNQGEPVNKSKRYQLIGNIMTKVYGFEVNDFPITGKLNIGVASIEINFPSAQYVEQTDQETLTHMMKRFSTQDISKILHYVLAEKHLLIVSQSRTLISQMFQVIRLGIYPFNWLFPIVYSMSQFFYPYLQSPMPLIAGCLLEQYESLPKHDFVVIFLDNNKKMNLRQISSYKKNIGSLKNFLDKYNRENGGRVLRSYMRKLKKFIEKGAIQEELTQFLIDFMETQLVSFYKQQKGVKST